PGSPTGPCEGNTHDNGAAHHLRSRAGGSHPPQRRMADQPVTQPHPPEELRSATAHLLAAAGDEGRRGVPGACGGSEEGRALTTSQAPSALVRSSAGVRGALGKGAGAKPSSAALVTIRMNARVIMVRPSVGLLAPQSEPPLWAPILCLQASCRTW